LAPGAALHAIAERVGPLPMLRWSAERMDELLTRAAGTWRGMNGGIAPNNKALRIARRANFVRGIVVSPEGFEPST
jgi:hypothetical protein